MDAKVGLIVLLVFVMGASYGDAAPMSPAAEESSKVEDKRSSEVIFFENQQKGNVAKRSEKWNEGGDTKIDELNSLSQPKPKISQSDVEAIEEEAFYEALEFLVDKLLSDDDNVDNKNGHEDEEAQGKDDAMEETTIKYFDSKIEDVTTLTPVKEEENSDEAASQLSQLMGHDQHEVNGKENLQEDDDSDENDEEDEQNTVTGDSADDEGDDYRGEYSIDSIIDYLDYLNMIKAAERKLQVDLGASKDRQEKSVNKEKETKTKDQSASPRKKRSLDPTLSIADDVTDDSKSNAGVCLTAQEVSQLRDLLLELAKEKLQSEDLISYLLNANSPQSVSQFNGDDEDINDAAEDEDSYVDVDDLANDDGDDDDTGYEQNNGEAMREYMAEAIRRQQLKDYQRKNQLSSLALQLSRQQKKSFPVYGSVWPYYRK